jgi:outer membrane protein
MKKIVVTMATAALLVAAASGAALADSIKGTLGLTGKLGFIIPADSKSDTASGKVLIETDPGFIIGGGVIYGFDDNAAFEMEVTHSWFNVKNTPGNLGDATMTDMAFGLQYRFTPERKLVPYIGAGLDILMPDMDRAKVDTTIGAHIKGGVDYFLERNIALTGELKLTGGLDADITNNTAGGQGGKFDPSSVSVMGGVRLYFR